MTHSKIHRLWLLAVPVVGAVAMMVVVNLRSASADGIPATTPLFYTGKISENGLPVTGVRPIVVDLWDDVASPDVAHRKCETVVAAATVTNGSFRVALDATCLAAIHQNRDLWVEIFVGTASLGRRKIGAVPYAVEAAHAADVPASALVLPSSLVTMVGPLADWRNNATVSVAGIWTDIPGRTVTFTKRFATSKLKVTYQDTLGTYGIYYAGCGWRILLDGTPISVFSDADADNPGGGAPTWKMSNAAHVAWGTGAAGAHTVLVQNRGDTARGGTWGTGTAECLQGWNTTGNFLSVEEIP